MLSTGVSALFPRLPVTLAQDGNYTLLAGEAASDLIERTTTTGADATFTFPAVPSDTSWIVKNDCSGLGKGSLVLIIQNRAVVIAPDTVALVTWNGAHLAARQGRLTTTSAAQASALGTGELKGGITLPSWTVVTVANGTTAVTLDAAQASAQFLFFYVANAGLVTVTFPATTGVNWIVRNDSTSLFAIRCKAAGNADVVDVNPGYDGLLLVDDAGAMSQILVKHGDTHLPDGSDPITNVAIGRGAQIILCSGFTPTGTGADTLELLVPYDPKDGTTSKTWNVRRIWLRVVTAGGAPVAVVEKSTAATAFAAATVGTLTMGNGDYEVAVTATLGTVASGNKLRFNVTTLATALNWSIGVELGS